ncbi:hypothetical protein ACI78R_07125 [Geodermatophilus sp. SYSU D01106]
MEQHKHFDAYGEFAASMRRHLRPGGLLFMRLGETAPVNMTEAIRPMLEPYFDIEFAGRRVCPRRGEPRSARPKGDGRGPVPVRDRAQLTALHREQQATRAAARHLS